MVRYPPECGGEEEEEGWIGNSDCGCNISLISIERGLCVISAGMWSSIVSFSQHRPSVCRHGAIKCYFVRWLNLFIISKRHAEETCPGYWFLRIVLRPLVEMTDWAARIGRNHCACLFFFFWIVSVWPGVLKNFTKTLKLSSSRPKLSHFAVCLIMKNRNYSWKYIKLQETQLYLDRSFSSTRGGLCFTLAVTGVNDNRDDKRDLWLYGCMSTFGRNERNIGLSISARTDLPL